MADIIHRQYVLDVLSEVAIDNFSLSDSFEVYLKALNDVSERIKKIPSAQPEPLTDKEQRIFLAAMGREEKVCKEVDEECRDCREPYEDSLVKTCHEITRKVKDALWVI